MFTKVATKLKTCVKEGCKFLCLSHCKKGSFVEEICVEEFQKFWNHYGGKTSS